MKVEIMKRKVLFPHFRRFFPTHSDDESETEKRRERKRIFRLNNFLAFELMTKLVRLSRHIIIERVTFKRTPLNFIFLLVVLLLLCSSSCFFRNPHTESFTTTKLHPTTMETIAERRDPRWMNRSQAGRQREWQNASLTLITITMLDGQGNDQ